MHVLITNINGNPNIGLYGFANDHICLLGEEVPEETAKQIGRVLQVPVHRIQLCGTSLVGVFCAGNNKGLVIPDIVFDQEQEALKKCLASTPLKLTVIKTKYTALGNNILCNDRGCLASTDLSDDNKKRIREALLVPLKPGTLGSLPTVGSCGVVNGDKALVHKGASDEELVYLADLLGVTCARGTLNMGSPFVRSAILNNKHGFVVSDISGGPEITHVDEILGYLHQEEGKDKETKDRAA